jgi:hypothetical protein
MCARPFLQGFSITVTPSWDDRFMFDVLEAAVDGVAGVDPDGLSGAELSAAVVELHRRTWRRAPASWPRRASRRSSSDL